MGSLQITIRARKSRISNFSAPHPLSHRSCPSPSHQPSSAIPAPPRPLPADLQSPPWPCTASPPIAKGHLNEVLVSWPRRAGLLLCRFMPPAPLLLQRTHRRLSLRHQRLFRHHRRL